MAVSSQTENQYNLLQRWKTYLLERSPPAALLVISGGISLAPMALRHHFDPLIFVVGVLAGYALLVQMRLADEIKDLDKDRRIHPERPLPRGLLTVSQVKLAMYVTMSSLLVISSFFRDGQLYGGVLLALSTIFAWLMFKEFFIGAALAKEPMTYALTHQIIIFPVYGWIGAVYGLAFFTTPAYVGWLLCNFGASFTFEICRKLDPGSPPEAGTYLRHYGSKRTAIFAAIFVAISIFGAYWSGNLVWLLPVQVLMLLSLLQIPLKPGKFKSVEGMAVLFAAWMLWYPSIQWGLSALGIGGGPR